MKSKAFPAAIYLFHDMVLIGHDLHRPYQLVLKYGILDFRYANGHPSRDSLYCVQEHNDHVLSFDKVSDKLAWLTDFYGITKH
jgi:hypothetical protein